MNTVKTIVRTKVGTTVETKRLYLRKLTLEDAPVIYQELTSINEVTKYLNWKKHESIRETLFFLKLWIKEDHYPKNQYYGIIRIEDDLLIGSLNIQIDLKDIPHIGYILSPKVWNLGYATEIVQGVVSFLFKEGYNQINAEVRKENLASIHVLNHVGFHQYEEKDNTFLFSILNLKCK